MSHALGQEVGIGRQSFAGRGPDEGVPLPLPAPGAITLGPSDDAIARAHTGLAGWLAHGDATDHCQVAADLALPHHGTVDIANDPHI